ncbi:MAG: replicative DNA helicase [Patescibacteria group bacterium]
MARDEKTGGVRMPPQDTDAEISVLGSLMLDKDAIFRIADTIGPRDFYKPVHQEIYEAMLDLFGRREPIDVLSVTSRLREKKKLEEIGGSAYLATLVNSVPTASNIEHYGTIVKRKRLLRDLIEASAHIAQLGYREADDVEQLLDQAEQKIFGIAKDSLRQEFFPVGTALDAAWERIERLHKGDGALRGVSTGYPDIDNYLAGLQRSDLIVLAARPSLGKTSLALNIARNVAVEEQKAVGIFSLEMSREQLVDRLIAAEAGVDLWRLRTGRMRDGGAENDFTRVRDAMDTLSKAKLFMDDSPSPTVMELRAKARRLQAQHDLGLIVIDYLQLIRGHGRTESRVQEVSEISRSLKGLAKELNIPVLAVSQLSRAIEIRGTNAKPKLSDLRESGTIEQDSDVVLFIHRERKDDQSPGRSTTAEILIEKHRNGPTGKVELFFHEETASFRSLAKNYEEPLGAI